MEKAQQTSQRAAAERAGAKGRRLARPLAACPGLHVLLLLSLAGCTEPSRPPGPGSAPADPLLGGPPLQGFRPAAPQPNPPAPVPPPNAVLPPLPAPNPATSNAALASGLPAPSLDPGHDLRIGDRRGGAGDASGAGPGSAASGSGAVLGRPEVPPAASPVARGGAQPLSYEQLQAQLTAHGVAWHHLELIAETGEWKFVCFIPDRQNPQRRRVYQAQARDSLAAVQAVLERIEKGQ